MVDDTDACSIRAIFESHLSRSCERLGLDAAHTQLLHLAAREIRTEIPLIRDDGSLSIYIGYRVQHHNARGPYKGGLRFHPSVDADEVRCFDPEASALMVEAIKAAAKEGDSLGGVVTCVARNVPAGLGEPVLHVAQPRIIGLAGFLAQGQLGILQFPK